MLSLYKLLVNTNIFHLFLSSLHTFLHFRHTSDASVSSQM
jgi:hypothetical protein